MTSPLFMQPAYLSSRASYCDSTVANPSGLGRALAYTTLVDDGGKAVRIDAHIRYTYTCIVRIFFHRDNVCMTAMNVR